MARMNFQQGIFTPKNPDKYIGKHRPRYRSGWELTFMRMCDNHPSISGWASEAQRIPYRNPITGKMTHYVPDFFIVYTDKDGARNAECIEIKPKMQTLENAKSQGEKYQAVINMAKWEAAQQWCKRNGVRFRVVTEEQLFNNPQKRTTKRRKRK